MTPSQIIADNAKTLVRAQQKQSSSELSGERENHIHVGESHKQKMSEKGKRVSPGVVLLATKSEMSPFVKIISSNQYEPMPFG